MSIYIVAQLRIPIKKTLVPLRISLGDSNKYLGKRNIASYKHYLPESPNL